MTTATAPDTAVAIRDENAPPAPIVAAPMAAISMFPSDQEYAMVTKIATMALAAGETFMPKNIKTPAQAIAIMLAGREVGLRPMTALRHLYLVNGKTDIETRAMMGICIANDPSIRFEVNEYTPEAVTITMHRRTLAKPLTVRYTVDDAKKSGQYKPGPWQSYTRDMLFAAAGKRCCRYGAPDLINGIEASMQTVEAAREVEAAHGDYRIVEPDAAAITAPADIPADAFNAGDDGSMPVETDAPDQRDRIRSLMVEAQETWDKPSFAKWAGDMRERFPELKSSATIGKLGDDRLREIADAMQADVRPEPQGALPL